MPATKCPTCGKVGEWWAGGAMPFCSGRCKMVDLGKWLGEEYVISEPLHPEHFQEYEGLEGGEELDRPEPEE